MRTTAKFLLGDELRERGDLDPTMTLLEYLREVEGRTGTKEGCAEGDCGACTVVLGEPDGAEMRYRAVNSCIHFMPLLDGAQIVTVEDLAAPDGALHPVQDAMVETHGSQCGFCTPGIVMSLYTLYRKETPPTRAEINDVLAGNLCRCTGYGPIVAAAGKMFDGTDAGEFKVREQAAARTLKKVRDGRGLALQTGGRSYFAPEKVDQLAELLIAHPDATIIAGLTDVGLWVTKLHRILDTVIYIGNVKELHAVKETKSAIEISAAVSYTSAHDLLARHYPDLGELIRRLGSVQIRNVGTVCGNIANGSPIGDMPPALIALDSELVLRKGASRRTIPLKEFFIDYGKQDLEPGEFVEKVIVPKPNSGEAFCCYKLAKRFDQDISAVCGAFFATFSGKGDTRKAKDIRIGFGGMAGIPKRAVHAEKVLSGAPWSEATVDQAMLALEQDFSPMTDMRGSAAYRLRSAKNLLLKFYFETAEGAKPIRVLDDPDGRA